MKKIMMVLIALLAIAVTISAVSAEGWNFSFGEESNSDGGSVSVENEKLKVQDEEFTIPDGYKEDESARLLAEESPDFKNAKVTVVTLENGDKNITVKVIFGDDMGFTLSADEDGENKTIGDINGVYVPEDGEIVFSYLPDSDNLVQIHAPDDETLEAFLK